MDLLLSIFIRFDYWFRNSILSFLQVLLFQSLNKGGQIRKILVFRTGSIGDSICALPAFSVIRANFPEAHIDILTNAGSGSAVSLDKLIDLRKFNSVINYSGMNKRALASELKEKKYDLFVELPQYDAPLLKQVRSMLFARYIGADCAFGWRISQTFILNKFQERNGRFLNERDRLLMILKHNDLDISDAFFIVSDTPNEKVAVKDALKKINLIDRVNNIGIVIGSKVERNKWPIDYFKQVVAYYSGKGFNVLLFGGKEDYVMAEKLVQKNTVNFCGRFSPLETGEAMRFCALVISNDTGPMHLAYLVNTPVVALFSSRDFPGKWYPPESKNNAVFRSAGIPCSICIQTDCNDNICMKKIMPIEVIEKANVILKQVQQD